MDETEFIAALPGHAPEVGDAKQENSRPIVPNVEQMESKTKGQHARIDAAQLPFLGLARESNEDDGQKPGNNARNEHEGEVR